MILKALTNYLNITKRTTIQSLYHPFHQAFTFSTQEADLQKEENQTLNKKKKMFASKKPQKQQTSEWILTKLIKSYRNRMDKTDNPIKQLTYHTKKIADFYKKNNHHEFVQQKSQILQILQTINQTNFTSLELPQYFNLLDFIRICSNIESLNYISTFQKAREKIFGLYNQFKKKIQVGNLVQVSTLYSKLAPLYHPQTFTVSGFLHDQLAQSLAESKKIGLSTMQIYIILRSMGKRQFLSFPDKKILQMLIKQLQQRKISQRVIPFAVAIKDLDLEVNISDYRYYSIGNKIQSKAVRITQNGLLDQQNIQYLQTIKKSQNQYFLQIFKHITKQYISTFGKEGEIPSYRKLKEFVNFVKQLPNYYQFQIEEKKKVVEYCGQLYTKEQDEQIKKKIGYELLDLIRNNFFAQDLTLLDQLFYQNKIAFLWSFPLQYSMKNIKFPISILQQKATNLPKFRSDANTIKLWLCLNIQSHLHPQNQLLQKSYKSSIENLKNYDWTLEDLNNLIKSSVFYPQLIAQFHNRFHHYYLERLIPSKQEIINERSIKRGDKSTIIKFWEYLLIQQQSIHNLISKIPIYAVYVACYRQKKIRNQQIYPKAALLQTIDHLLSSNKIKFTDHQSLNILQTLISYASKLSPTNEKLLQLYWNCITHLINQYSSIKKSNIPYAHFIFSKLLNTQNKKIKYSLYYKNFLSQLIRLLQKRTLTNSYSYLITSIIREGLHNNSISDIHFAHLQITHFAQHQQNIIFTLFNKYQDKELTPQNLIVSLKVSNHQNLMNIFQSVSQIISKSTIQELSKYLIHYSFETNKKQSQAILMKICSQFIKKLNPKQQKQTSIDLMPILKNISQLSTRNPSLYKEIMRSICIYLTAYPSSTFLIDHSQILDLLNNQKIIHQPYQQSLWQYCRKQKYPSSAVIGIMLKLNAKHNNQGKSFEFTKEDFELAYNVSLTNPQDFLKLIVYHQEAIENVDEKIKDIANNIQRSLPSSLIIAYLQAKYGIVIAKSRNNLQRAHLITSKFIKSIQENGIKLKLQSQTGQLIYRITQKTILFITDQIDSNELLLRQKITNFIYPQHDLIQLSSNSNVKEIKYALSQLNLLEKEIFTPQIIQKIEGDIQNS